MSTSHIFFLVLFTLGSFANLAKASQASSGVHQTLHTLEKNIQSVQKAISVTQKEKLQKEKILSENEKEMSNNLLKLRELGFLIEKNNGKIESISRRVQTLQQSLKVEQERLSAHLNLFFYLDKYEWFPSLLVQQKKETWDEQIVFHQYIVHARQRIIENIRTTQEVLAQEKNNFQEQLKEQESLQKALVARKEELEKTRNTHLIILETLRKDMLTQSERLGAYEKNRVRLSKLLKKISDVSEEPNFARTSTSLSSKAFHGPISLKIKPTREGQGLLFNVKEGTPVHAIQSGKVVFSDWFNGYGLLIIIDHGKDVMSLYANNQALLLKKGAIVQSGETIALSGHSGGQHQNALYFEFRKNGKPVSISF